MKTIKKLYLFIFLSFFMCFLAIFATPTGAKADSGGYTIQNYDIKIDVKENNVLYIKETIKVYFDAPRHGIYRIIPMKNTVYREDGEETRWALITDVDVNHKSSTSYTDNYLEIRIGDENKYVYGNVTYKISYKYNLGPDPLKDMDELYFNVIGSEWATTIKNANIVINMPKEFDANNFKVARGNSGNDTTNGLNVTIDGKRIEISATNLGYYEAVTVKATLPESYFQNESYLNEGVIDYFFGYVLPIILAILMFILWYKKGKDDEVVEVVNFYPPEGFNSLDVGYFYEGKTKNEHVISLIVLLAAQGYIAIDETDKKGEEFVITKLKEYDGNDADLKSVFKGIFRNKQVDEVYESDLNEKFYSTIQSLTSRMHRKSNTAKYKIYEDFKFKGIVLGVLSCVTIMLCPLLCPSLKTGMWFILLLPIFFGIFLGVFDSIALNKNIGMPWFGKLFILFFNICLPFAFYIIVKPLLVYSLILIPTAIVSVICLIIAMVCTIKMPKRTKEGLKLYGEILGFKNFLETAEKDRIESLIMQDPNYFYNTIPYAYVLDVTDKWIEKFEGLAMIPTEMTTTTRFICSTHTLNRMSRSINRSYTSHTSSSSSGGGGFSGGGFSGGGSGGGGGGSW